MVEVTAADRAAATSQRWFLRRRKFSNTNISPSLSRPQARIPNAACPRRLCQPPWTRSTSTEGIPPRRRHQLQRNAHPERQPLFGREGSGGRGASLREAASPPRISPHLSLIHHSPVVWVCFVGGFGGFGEGLLGRHVGNAGCAAGDRSLKGTNRLGGRGTVAAVYTGRVQ